VRFPAILLGVKLAWRLLAVLAALASAGLIAGYSIVTPAFEAPDEPGHFRYVQALASGGGLPVQGQAGDYDPEFSQPPLYYLIESVAAKVLPAAGAPVPGFDHHNPYQNTTVQGNVNLYSHPVAEQFPWSGQILQLHAMRLANLLFAAVTLAATYGIGRELGSSPGLAGAAAAVVGFLPQFDFIAGALNADNAITAASSAALHLLLHGIGRPPSKRAGVLAGIAIAAAMLSKLSGLAVLPLAAGFLLWRAWRERKLGFVAEAAIAAGVALIAGGWWYVRNLVLYGDVLGWQPMLTAIGAMLRPQALSPIEAGAVLLREAPTALGVFGWNNLRLPMAVYLLAGGFALAAVLGLATYAPRPGQWERSASGAHDRWLRAGLLVAWVAVFSASLIRWVEVNTDAAQWRLLFPAFPVLAVLLILGLSRLTRVLAVLTPMAMAGLSAASLLLVVRPAYLPEPAYDGPIQHQVNVRFGDRLELAGYDDPRPRNPTPGQPVALTLYWRALQPLALDDVVDLVALDAAKQQAFKQPTWPLAGRAPTSTWQPGHIVRDRHVVPGTPGLAPGAYTFFLDVFQPLAGAPRLPLAGGGTTLKLGRFLVLPPQTGAPPSAKANFGGSLALLGFTYSDAFGEPVQTVQVNLDWQVTGPVARDYTVFVHLLDTSGKLVSQSDSQPDAGRFPFSLLPVGLRVHDRHALPVEGLTEGHYQLEIGVYDPGTGARLKIAGGETDSLVFPEVLGR